MSYDEEPADRGVPPSSVPIVGKSPVDGDTWPDEHDRVADRERANSANPRALEPDTDPRYAFPDGDDDDEEEEEFEDFDEEEEDFDDEIEDWEEEDDEEEELP